MIRLSRGARYSIIGLIYMAGKPDTEYSYVWEIAEAKGIPKTYLAKLFQYLAGRGVVKSFRGRVGGFQLARPASEITVLNIIEAIEGPLTRESFMKWDDAGVDSAALNAVFDDSFTRFKTALGAYTLAQIASWGRAQAAGEEGGFAMTKPPITA